MDGKSITILIFLIGITYLIISYHFRESYNRRHRIRLMRKNVKDKEWLEKKKWELLEHSQYLNNFKSFECSTHFKGYDLATENRKAHDKMESKNSKRLRFINNLINK